MKNKLFKSYLLISVIVLLLITFTASIYLASVYKNNSKIAVNSVEKIQTDITTVFLAEGSFNSKLFKNRIKKAISDNNRIQSIIISDPENRINYLYIKNKKLLKTNPEKDILGYISYPEYKNTGLSYSLINESFIIPGHNIHNIEILYKVLSNSEILKIIKISIIFILIFIISSIIFILYLPARKSAPFIKVNTIDESFDDSSSDKISVEKNDKQNNQNGDLVWEEYLEKKLQYELEKAASFDNDVSLAIVSYEKSSIDIKQIKKDVIDTVSSFFSLDLSFEFGKSGFAVIMPDSGLELSISSINALIIRLEQLFKMDNLNAGLSSRNGRIISPARIINEASGALNKAFTEPDRPVIAFKSDPDKYRDYISSRNFNT